MTRRHIGKAAHGAMLAVAAPFALGGVALMLLSSAHAATSSDVVLYSSN